ncbi:MAG: hypothetical protein JNJ90_09475 [Saprospiraceae bacterium]|jgi:predicted HTH transcriptional regulator|nr:hypothetical protein [Saprospiraceae bacterium]
MRTKNFFNHLRRLISGDELDGAISELSAYLKNSPVQDEAILQSARHRDLLKQVRLGVVDHHQANLTKNQIRTGLLDLIRSLETLESVDAEQLDDYKKITEKIGVNRGVGTSELLKNKSLDDLDEKELTRLFAKERVVELFDTNEINMEDLSEHERLVYLSLAENGHIFKGTFLCLGKRNQIQTICPTATESKFILFKGVERDIILDLKTLTGNTIQQYESMMMLLRKHIPLGRDRAMSEDVYEIPIVAVREFVANAFVHRDYSDVVKSYIQVELYDDRLEIKSPGHLPKNLDVSRIEATVLVNPVIAAIFHLYKHIERAGTGIRVAQQALQAQGLKPARIENIEHPNMVKVTLYRNVRTAEQPRKWWQFF